ncbi:unnamed protein product [Caenorhabditis angaria]|uniref:ZP domain-containing protein n=1 Tax=Caenorhabditis angaria TaxID=860376 RepID=A0A9P1IJX2_9PELO|nr:unnamed protein product [Caenorhabditis angaria]
MRNILGVFSILVHFKTKCDYTEIMNMKLGVKVELPNIVYDNESIITSTGHPKCKMSIHRTDLGTNQCARQQLGIHDKIDWSTKLCYIWHCPTLKYAMRVENCWMGSPRHPVTILDKNGCSPEKIMLETPVYSSYNKAVASGFASIRQENMKHIHFGCTIRLCHVCDVSCQAMTPPRTCNDNLTNDYDAMWASSSKMRNFCYPTTTISPNDLNSNLSSGNFKFLIFTLSFLLS